MSSRATFLGLGFLASVLAAALALELDGIGEPAEDETGIVPIHHVPKAQPRVASEDPEDHTDSWVATGLARPLFSRDRRPTPVLAKAGGGPAMVSLPRLTGIVVGPFGRTAIFAGTDGAKPIAVTEGNTLGAYTVQSIGSGVVTVTGPQGEQQVSLTGDAETRRALAAEIPQLPQPGRPPGLPGVAGQQAGMPPGTVPGLPLGQQRHNLLNLRNGLQFQRPPPGIRSGNPNQEGSD